MLALRNYHSDAVLQHARNYGVSCPPSWDRFCHQYLWGMLPQERAFKRPIETIRSLQECCTFIQEKHLLSVTGSFPLYGV
jgi:hypothetical protein